MDALLTVLRYEVLFFLGGLALLISYRLLTRTINLNGLLLDKTGGGGVFSPSRLQMLVVTLGIAIYYVVQVIETKPGSLPSMPTKFLLALGGSHSLYLGGKLYGMFLSKFGVASPEPKARIRPTRNGG